MLTAEELVKDGYLQITDRAKDLIKTGGEWISSIDLENIALQALFTCFTGALLVQKDKC